MAVSLALDPPTGTTPEETTGDITIDETFEALSNRRRRYVIHLLSRRDEQVSLRALSRRVAAWENEKRPELVTAAERRRVYNALQQFHLPKLDDAGVIDYDDRRGTVTGTEHVARLRTHIHAPDRYRRLCIYSVAVGAGVAAAVGVGALLFAAVPVVALVAVALVTILVAGAVALRHRESDGTEDELGPPPELRRGER